VIARGVVFDSSAVVAMMTREASAMSLTEQLEVMRPRLISAGTVLEVSLVLQQRFGESADLLVDDFLHAFSVEVVAFDAAQLRMARDAARRFGRGRHRAALNYGDCFSYALAMTRGLPLLFVGEDFAQTDVRALTS
jgi:ribonuclease VapC